MSTTQTATTTTTTIPNAAAGSFLLVIGGQNSGGYSNKVELVSLYPSENAVPECLASLGDLPNTVGSSAAGAVMAQGIGYFDPGILNAYNTG